MNENKQEIFHDQLETTIDKVLSPIHFIRQERRRWVREWQWKTDYATFYPRTDILINFYMSLPGEPAAEKSYILAQTDLGHLSHRGRYRYPSLFRSTTSVLAEIEHDLALVEPWFARFATPANCLAYLRSGADRNFIAGRPGSRAYEYCVKYLQPLSSNGLEMAGN